MFSFICWIAFTANGILKRDELIDFPKLGWPHFAILVAHLFKDLAQTGEEEEVGPCTHFKFSWTNYFLLANRFLCFTYGSLWWL